MATEEPITRLRARLRSLYEAVQRPPYRRLSAFAAQQGHSLPSSTIGDLLNGSGMPRWETIGAYVSACGRYARAHRLTPPSALLEIDRWWSDYRSVQNQIAEQFPKQGKDSTLTRKRGGVRVVPAQLPANIAAFTGRARQLAELDSLLDPSHRLGTVVVSAVAGTAGVGKTALAVHWAHRVLHLFPDGQLFIDLCGYHDRPPLRPLDGLAQMLRALGVAPEQVPNDEQEAASLYRSHLAKRQMLIVLDNAGNAEQVRPLLPGSAGCLVVVTSRDTLSGLIALDGARHMILEPLTAEEARGLLAQFLSSDRLGGEPDESAELARLCGHLPLALRIAAAQLLTQPHRRLTEFIAELRRDDRLVKLEIRGDSQAAVGRAFQLSYRNLPSAAARMFRLLSLVPGADFTRHGAAALADVPSSKAGQLLDEITAASLIQAGAADRYAFHDLLHSYAAQQSRLHDRYEERQGAAERLFNWYASTADAAAGTLYPQLLRIPLQKPPNLMRANPFEDNAAALRWLDSERHNLVAVVAHTAEAGPRRLACHLADALRGYFALRFDVVSWEVVARAALSAAQLDSYPEAQVVGHFSLGDVYWYQSQYDTGIEQYAKAAGIAQQAGWTEGLAAAHGNLGAIHRFAGNLDAAIGHLTEALALNEQLSRTKGMAANHANLGAVEWEKGSLRKAASHYERALAIYRETRASAGIANGLSNLGFVYHALGRVDEALGLLTTALTMHREHGTRVHEAETLRCLATVYRDVGRLDEARSCATAAASLAADIGDPRLHAEVLTACASVEDDPAAVSHLTQAVELATASRNRYSEADALAGLAVAHDRLCDSVRAGEHAQRAVRLARQAGYRMLEGNALSALGSALSGQDRPQEALRHLRSAVAIQRRTGFVYGQAQALMNLGAVLRQLGEPVAAAAAWHEAAELFERTAVRMPRLPDESRHHEVIDVCTREDGI